MAHCRGRCRIGAALSLFRLSYQLLDEVRIQCLRDEVDSYKMEANKYKTATR